MTLNARIKRFRESLEMSKAELARRVGVKTQAVQQWEAGKTTPKRSKLPKLAEALQKSIAELELGSERGGGRHSLNFAQPTAAYGLPEEALEIAKAWSLLGPERQAIYRSLIFNDAVLEQALPGWLKFGTPKSPRYKDLEAKFEALARRNENQLTLEF